MAKAKKVDAQSARRTADPQSGAHGPRYCTMPFTPAPVLQPGIGPERARAIIVTSDKWLNGTVLHYYFFDRETDGEQVLLTDGTSEWRSWVGPQPERDVVRQAFKQWKDLDIGLIFKEVDSRDEAEIRIGFMKDDGAWSYLGKKVLEYGKDQRTMNFGWSLLDTDGPDTALHEIGHTLGLPHEHQNPHAGIVWDEEAVYTDLAGSPNYWSREKTHFNIIRKITADTVQGSY